MEVYCKRFLQNIKVTWYNLTDERIKEFNRGCLILKSKEERFGDTLTSTIETCQFISDDKSLLLVVINTSGGTLYLPDVDISFIKSKTQILCKNGNFGNHATNKAAMYDIKRFLQGSEQDVSPVSISRP
ncbi:uncharacterized protein LOC134272199 [Saccostrea cucullata]|uniref:uncharacterized protein LOC134272199 n=1 Tax=Saccostrea cuccullata TaxID=36930 RepID=UPI002ED337EB